MNAAQYRKIHKRQPGQCTWCGQPVPKGRRTFCSESCVNAFRLKHAWQYVRLRVLDRCP